MPPTDAASNTERTRRAWPFVVTVLAGLTLLYFAPRVAVIALFTLLAVAFGIFAVQRRSRRRQGASTQLST